MEESKINAVINELAYSLQTRNYNNFVSYFTDNAIFEIPFSLNGGTIIYGKKNIERHFENVRQKPISTLIEIQSIYNKAFHCKDGNTVIVEYYMKGKTLKTNDFFEIQSSIANITFNDNGIINYKDFPNTLGIAQNAGILSQLATSWIKK